MADDLQKVETGVDSLQINGTSSDSGTDTETEIDETWGLPQSEVYKIALKFYKEKEGGKAVTVTYKDKLKLMALTKQVAFGKYRPDNSPDVGFLDVVGKDRRQAWQSLGDISKEESMKQFVDIVNNLCALFKPYVEAHKREKEEQERKRREEEERLAREAEERERQRLEEEARQRQEQERQKQLQQELQIRNALNQQTALQFRQYAEQQCPGNPEQQEVLIKQLQEQHFQQYMQQVYQQQVLHQQQQYQQLQHTMSQGGQQSQQQGGVPPVLPAPSLPLQTGHNGVALPSTKLDNHITPLPNHVPPADGEEQEPANGLPIAAPSMWTRKDIKEFKESIRKDPDSVIKVGSGETVTVRVPTHEDGTCLFWEFATDSYDLGFGVYFEWTIAPSNQVSVHVSESSDEEEEDEEGGGYLLEMGSREENESSDNEEEDEDGGGDSKSGGEDVEKGSGSKSDNHPPTDEIIPVYRRDCHEEVYCGSHMYPGRGVYLLKFDNSYSLWRSKTLFYRVYYTR